MSFLGSWVRPSIHGAGGWKVLSRPMEFHIHATRPSVVVDLPRGCTDNIFEYIYICNRKYKIRAWKKCVYRGSLTAQQRSEESAVANAILSCQASRSAPHAAIIIRSAYIIRCCGRYIHPAPPSSRRWQIVHQLLQQDPSTSFANGLQIDVRQNTNTYMGSS